CVLHDIRLLSGGNARPALLIVANRDLGDGYADDAPVHFDYYVLTENEDGVPGHPRFYFRATHSTTARANYCDVNDAFAKELHLGQ
ncbi:carbapenem self-resistance protein CarG family protein, partial [Salmonella enterica]